MAASEGPAASPALAGLLAAAVGAVAASPAPRAKAAAMAAALLRAAIGVRGSAEAGLDEDECEDEKEVTERMLLIEPVVKAAVQGSTCSGNARAKRNLAVHALHGQGLFALRGACRNPQRAQRGGPRKKETVHPDTLTSAGSVAPDSDSSDGGVQAREQAVPSPEALDEEQHQAIVGSPKARPGKVRQREQWTPKKMKDGINGNSSKGLKGNKEENTGKVKKEHGGVEVGDVSTNGSLVEQLGMNLDLGEPPPAAPSSEEGYTENCSVVPQQESKPTSRSSDGHRSVAEEVADEWAMRHSISNAVRLWKVNTVLNIGEKSLIFQKGI